MTSLHESTRDEHKEPFHVEIYHSYSYGLSRKMRKEKNTSRWISLLYKPSNIFPTILACLIIDDLEKQSLINRLKYVWN